MITINEKMNRVGRAFTALALILLGLFFGLKISDEKIDAKNKAVAELLFDKNELLRSRDAQGREIVKRDQIISEQSKKLTAAISDFKEMKKLANKITVKTVTEYVDVEVPVIKTVTLSGDTVNRIAYHDQWLDITAEIRKDSVRFDSLLVRNDIKIEIGEVKSGFFKPTSYQVLARNENPHTTTNDLISMEFKPKKKFFQRSVVKIAIGVVAGYFINQRLSH